MSEGKRGAGVERETRATGTFPRHASRLLRTPLAWLSASSLDKRKKETSVPQAILAFSLKRVSLHKSFTNTNNVRFKMKISQNRKRAHKNGSKQLL